MPEYVMNIKPPKNKRFTIGFLDENAHDEYHGYMMSGVFEAARKHDLNVIRFGHFATHITNKYDSEINMVLNHIQQYDLDGLLFLGWARVARGENFEVFKQLFESIPVLSVGSEVKNIPSVYVPGDIYIQEILLHLIKVHHLQRIAFVAPFYPDDRSRVYQDTLKKFGIYHPELYISETEIANLDLMQRGRRALAILADERKTVFDAIISLYNNETHAIIDELHNRGFKVPGDIVVTSYEDGEIGKFSTPSFTTVYYPWKELGFYGCEKMHELLTQGHVPLTTIVPGKLIIRNSCGCMPNSVSHAKAGPITAAKPLTEISEIELNRLNQQLQNAIHCFEVDGIALCKAFLADYQAQSNHFFLARLEQELEKLSKYYHFSECEDIVSILRKLLLPYVTHPKETLLWAETLFQQAQVMLQVKKTAAWAHEEIESKMVRFNLQEMGQILITHFNLPNIMDSLEANLAKLNLPSCYIYLFKNADNQIDLFADCELTFEYTDGIRIHSQTNSSGTAKQKLAEILFPENRAYAMNALLLYVADLFIGFAVFEPGPMDERIYQSLSLNISIAIYGAMLLDKLENSYKRLVEKSHREGMTEITSGILHNISNILNSLNVSIHFIKDLINTSSIEDFVKANQLLENNLHNLADFIGKSPKGKKLMQFYLQLEDPFKDLHLQLLANIDRLNDKVNLINDIVTAQQSYAGIKSILEFLDVTPIIEDALKINLASLEKNHIKIVKNYQEIPKLWGQRTKLFHILVNLIKNAKEAMLETPENQRKLIITVEQVGGGKYIRITDTGYGIPSGMLKSIFAYGYTTKKGGHGFGLHSCANYMTEMKGKIWAESDGPGKGATFVLEFK